MMTEKYVQRNTSKTIKKLVIIYNYWIMDHLKMWTHAPGCWFQSMYLKDELCFRRENPCMPTWDLKRKAKMHLLRANFPLNLGINNEQLRTISCMNLVQDKWLQGNALFHALLWAEQKSEKELCTLPGLFWTRSRYPCLPQLTAAS